MAVNTITADDFGIVDLTLKELTATAKVRAQHNLTQPQVATLLAYQGAGYVQPGQSLSLLNTNLVITGSGNGAHFLTATILNAGPTAGAPSCMTPRNTASDAVEFTSKRTWTSGAANALWALTVT